jgi:hypothetical protein
MQPFSMTALFGAAATLVAMNAQAALVSTDGGLSVYDEQRDKDVASELWLARNVRPKS